ncbi:hypothetical protein BV22DRAFT_1084908 [Leucogyrophana mollusca]|uniref:Uncharacterized protein n=1 Tax=Leucogyrophana mollusca TaxID=85980 RepID=A0ACB8BPT5_9AGAM|nr:hypothetical protein BV22DRAFT_1084908 [Leucogyrophana mollusca]
MSLLAYLPGDILLEIAGYLNSIADALHLSLSSQHLFTSICPALYANLYLSTVPQCTITLSMLYRRPDIARHVQKLFVRITGPGASDGYIVSAAIRETAVRLDALNTFVWDADEIPPYDDMWFALRISCPQLRTIATSYGSIAPRPHSHLFDFSHLLAFSLVLKEGFHTGQHDTDEHREPIPSNSRLWDMLIRRSPDLQELHITPSLSAPPVLHSFPNATPLYTARWPRLAALSLSLSLPHATDDPHPLIEFLDAHPNLHSLRTSLPLPPAVIPHLTHFAGPLPALPGPTHSTLHSLILTSPLLAGIGLPSLKNLRELRVAFTFHSPYESGSVLRSLVASCPGIVHLEIVCARRPSFQIQTLAALLSPLSRLRTLRLTLVRAPNERQIAECAAHMARTNPRLEAFAIIFVPGGVRLEDMLLSSPFDVSGTHASILCAPKHPYIESGAYTLSVDHHGLPVSLTSVERRPRLPIRILAGLGNPPALVNSLPFSVQPLASPPNQVKRYCLPLSPRRFPMKWDVLLERSAAGEEARVILVLLTLGGVAIASFLM